MNRTTLAMTFAAASLTGLLTSAAMAGDDHDHEGDVEVGLEGNQIGTEERLFEAFFDGSPWILDEPGFAGDPGGFAPGTTIGFNIMSPLGFWNGNGFDNLDPMSQESMSLSFAGGALHADTGNGFVPGFTFIEDADLGFDEHLDIQLNGAGGNAPATGIYLLSLQLTSNNYAPSEPFWIVFANGVDDRELDVAVDWVESNLVPAPGALALLGLAGLVSRRRRRHA